MEASHPAFQVHSRAFQRSAGDSFKLPVLLYRYRLGWILGKRFLQLTHVGRRSGKVHKTILAVLRFDEETNEIYAVSAWKGSDWYYNIQAAPPLEVETGAVRYVPQQRTLSPEEITATFIEYRQKHPIFSRLICRIPGWKWDSSYAEFLELARTLRGVAFRPGCKLKVGFRDARSSCQKFPSSV